MQSYAESVGQFADFVGDAPIDELGRRHVESFVIELKESGKSDATCNLRYRGLQQFFKWLLDEELIESNPMAKMRPPKVGVVPPDVLTDEAMAKLLAGCRGSGFEERRDMALIRLFLSTGARVGEVAGLKLEDVDLNGHAAYVTGKGNRGRVLALTAKTIKDLDRYLRVRAAHPNAHEPWLWLGKKGRMRESGIQQALKRRSDLAGVPGVHPHRFRHAFAHQWLSNGGSEGGLMRRAGWRSREMLNRYGASAADERARNEHAQLAPGEHL